MGSDAFRQQELEEYPKYKNMYLRSFDKMLQARKEAGLNTWAWSNADDVMDWWVNSKRSAQINSRTRESNINTATAAHSDAEIKLGSYKDKCHSEGESD